jgi:hypothetical protein
MKNWGKHIAPVCAALAVNLILHSCASGPRPPEKGTPAFYWLTAKEAYAAGDYLRTIDNLEQVAATENEFVAEALPWLLIMTSGMTRGYMEVADFFEGGARMNKADPTAFRRQMTQNRNDAARMSLRFAEAFGQFQKTASDSVTLSFGFPTGSPGLVAPLAKVGSGVLLQPAEIESANRTALMRAVLLKTCEAIGSPEDTAKAQEMFRATEVKLERAQFVRSMANSMHDAALMYGRNKLDNPSRMTIFCERAEEALKGIPESPGSKELLKKIQATLKQAKS